MDSNGEIEVRFGNYGNQKEEIGVESLQFGDEIQTLMSVPLETGSSFTALLGLPANQAVKLFHSPETEQTTTTILSGDALHHCASVFHSNFSVFNSSDTRSVPAEKVKEEPVGDSDLPPNSSPAVSDPIVTVSTKRKGEKKVKGSAKRSKNVAIETANDSKKLPYVHFRARRGQATDSHSLAERARREKINARMKLLQELVPGCNKISGMAMVLDEIINHVQSLQRQVEFLSMRLAAVNPRIDINLDYLFSTEGGSLMDCNIPGMVMPSFLLEGQLSNDHRQQYQQLWQFDGLHQPVWGREEGNPNFITPENTLCEMAKISRALEFRH